MNSREKPIQNKNNFNKISIPSQSKYLPQQNHNIFSKEISAYFKDLKSHLIQYIQDAEAVVGAVAWLGDSDVIQELAKKELVSIVITKKEVYESLKSKYKSIPRFQWDFLNEGIPEYFIDDGGETIRTWEAIRCVGKINSDGKNSDEKRKIKPLMHHKFLVFCNLETWSISLGDINPECPEIIEDEIIDAGSKLVPYAVWTGSFNLSDNATYSFENAIYITNPDIVSAYYQEWCQLMAFSEPINWRSPELNPEWRVSDKYLAQD